MKKIFLLIFITLSCCSGLDKDELRRALNNNSFEWHILAPDTTIVHRMHFFQDSLCLLVYRDEHDTTWSSLGYWQVNQENFSTSLRLRNRISDAEIALKSYRDGTLNFSLTNDRFNPAIKNTRIKAVKKNEMNRPDITPFLLGSWYDPSDSIGATFSEWKRAGKSLINPTFKFTKDSFEIRTEDYREKGSYRIVNCGHDIIILESEGYYYKNMTIEIDYIDSTQVRLRFDKNYKLKRNGE